MRSRTDEDRTSEPLHFFVSYSPLDELWATWIAWQLETAGFTTMLQAWDMVAGSNFIDFMDRGVSDSVAVIAVLSRHYMRSRYGRLEWQAALRSEPDHPERRLITVRVDEFPLEGLLSTITFVDLVGMDDPEIARDRLLRRITETVGGRAKPAISPPYPTRVPAQPVNGVEPIARTGRLAGRPPAAYPPALARRSARTGVTILHLRGPMFGTPRSGGLDTIVSSVDWWANAGGHWPDAVVVTGRLTSSGRIREFDDALDFLIQLRIRLSLEPHRLAIVPGPTDLTAAACRAYFNNCEADEVEPRPPYWPKWRHYSRFFAGLYTDVEGATFTEHQPWTLYEMADLDLVVAGLNSTMADSHLDGDGFGHVGAAQARWFGQRLRDRDGYRLAIIADCPNGSGKSPRPLGDAETFQAHVGGAVDVVLCDHADDAGPGQIGTIVNIDRRDGLLVVDDRPLMDTD